MHWTEEAIILSARKFGENSLLVEAIAASKGMYSGLVRGGQSRKKIADRQAGNVIEATWRGRLEEQLGTFAGELIQPVSAMVINEPAKLQAMLSLNSLLRKTLPDRHPYPEIYSHYREYLIRLSRHPAARPQDLSKDPGFRLDDDSEGWMEDYVWMEVALLKYLGYGLDLTACAVTGAHENLKYISPRTGRAVSPEGAQGYEDKLFKMPGIFSMDEENPSLTLPSREGTLVFSPLPEGGAGGGLRHDLLSALEITGYFIERSLFQPHNRQLPEERGRLIKMLEKTLIKCDISA